MKPGLSHALIGLVIWLVVSVAAFYAAPGQHLWFGVTAAAAFYVGRERRQSEEFFGSNRIPVWKWRPRALRDMAWPIGVVLLATVVAALLDRLAGALLFAALAG